MAYATNCSPPAPFFLIILIFSNLVPLSLVLGLRDPFFNPRCISYFDVRRSLRSEGSLIHCGLPPMGLQFDTNIASISGELAVFLIPLFSPTLSSLSAMPLHTQEEQEAIIEHVRTTAVALYNIPADECFTNNPWHGVKAGRRTGIFNRE